MKKFILIMMICLVLSGCGASTPASSGGSGNSPQSGSSDSTVIHFDDTVIFENDDLKISLTDFYTEEMNWTEGKETESIVNFKIKNKSSSDMLINFRGFLDDEKASCIMHNTGNKFEAGKSANSTYIIKREAVPKNKALDSVEELYDLNGTFEVMIYTPDDKLKDYMDIDFAVKDVVK